MIRTPGLAVLLGAMLAACQSTDNMTMGPEAESPVVHASVIGSSLLADDGESGQRVTTGGITPDLNDPMYTISTLPLDFFGFRERLSSHARRLSDLRVDGQFNAITKIGNEVVHEKGVIDCFTIVGNVARVEALVNTRNGVALAEGPERVYYTVEDGASKEKPDAYSGLLRVPLDVVGGFHCGSGAFATMYPVETGNVQVRG